MPTGSEGILVQTIATLHSHPPALQETLLDHNRLAAPAGALSPRQRRVLAAYFALPAAIRQVIFFDVHPWSLPLQRVLQRIFGGARNIDVRFASGPLAGCKFRASTAEKYFLLGAAFEPHVGELLKSLVAPGDIVCDVGAHAGYWTLALARLVGPAGRVIALEPSPRNYARLRGNLALNECAAAAGPVMALNMAAGDRQGSAAFVEAGSWSHLECVTYSAPASEVLPPARAAAHAQAQAGVEVEVRRLDDLVAVDLFPSPSFLLIDVEGAAGRVLRGAEQLLRLRRPRLLCELHNRAEQEEVVSLLAACGYRTRRVSAGRAFPLHLAAQAA